jgi:hypothetical protein
MRLGKGTILAGTVAVAILALALPASASWQFDLQWGTSGSGDGQLFTPRAVATDSAGNVYVADTGNNRIQQFDSSGAFIRKWGGSGSGAGQFNYPDGVAVGPAGHVYVADTGNHRIEEFDPSGAFVRQWGSKGSRSGQFRYPDGVAVDSVGHVFVTDRDNNRVQEFDSSGAFIRKWGSKGSGNGRFRSPEDVATDAAGHVYVADRDNSRVQEFDSSGAFIRKWGSQGSGNGQFSSPGGVAVDSVGHVFVADRDNNRVQEFDSSGAFIRKWGSKGSGGGQFNVPQGIAADAFGHLYVADAGNDRLQRFTWSATATNERATNVRKSGATLNVDVSWDAGDRADFRFEYYPIQRDVSRWGWSETPIRSFSASSSTSTTISEDVSPLAPASTYRFRYCADVNDYGWRCLTADGDWQQPSDVGPWATFDTPDYSLLSGYADWENTDALGTRLTNAIDVASGTNARLITIRAPWCTMQTSNNPPTYPQGAWNGFLQRVKQAKDAGLDVLVMLPPAPAPAWARPSATQGGSGCQNANGDAYAPDTAGTTHGDAVRSAWETFSRKAANCLQNVASDCPASTMQGDLSSAVAGFAAGNEPNITTFWSKVVSGANTITKDDAQGYARLASRTKDGIVAAGMNAPVGTAGLSFPQTNGAWDTKNANPYDYLKEMYDYWGGAPNWDAVGIHTYGDHPQTKRIYTTPADFEGQVSATRSLLTDNYAPRPTQIWVTEVGTDSGWNDCQVNVSGHPNTCDPLAPGSDGSASPNAKICLRSTTPGFDYPSQFGTDPLCTEDTQSDQLTGIWSAAKAMCVGGTEYPLTMVLIWATVDPAYASTLAVRSGVTAPDPQPGAGSWPPPPGSLYKKASYRALQTAFQSPACAG